jgi:hypothetical protein
VNALRIWRSWRSDFYAGDARRAAAVYTPAVLAEIAAQGFNAVWIRGILHELVPCRAFPEFGRGRAATLRSLRQVIRRGEQTGVRVFLYMQPVLGRPPRDPFWQRHPEAQGTTFRFVGRVVNAMCTSTPEVQAFLREGAERLSASLPGLGGCILITASEHVSHCYSHERLSPDGASDGVSPEVLRRCPRCAARRPREVIAEMLAAMRDGFMAAGHGAEIIAWNWSWSFYEPDPQEGIIRALPKGIRVLADFERGGRKRILGRPRAIDEYALSFAGPSARFTGTLRAARRHRLPVVAKLQIGTTHELATVPSLPLIGRVYDKVRGLRRCGVRDFMGCWNFGNMLTANTAALTRFLDLPRLPPRRQALQDFARDYFPGCEPRAVVGAWETFERAMDAYPFSIPFLYWGPINYAVRHPIEPAPLNPRPCGPAWLRTPRRGDELAASFGPFTLAEIIRGLGALQRGWRAGLRRLEEGLHGCRGRAAEEELRSARMVGHCFRSAWNLYRAYALRRHWSPRCRPALLRIARDELAHLPAAADLAAADGRMGFHAECQRYLFTAAGIRRKIRRLAAVATAHA